MRADWRPVLAANALLRRDAVRDADVLLVPERAIVLNSSAGTILRLCDGRREVAEIAGQVHAVFEEGEPTEDSPATLSVARFLQRMADLGCVR